jgi:DNA-binding MarR family transcriptional regulator
MTPTGPERRSPPGTAGDGATVEDRYAVVEAIRRLSLELDLFVDVFARRHALHRTDLDALGHLWEAEVSGRAMTPTRLSASLSLSPAATSASLDRLQRAGHVVRREDPEDRRRTFVTLSDEARTLSTQFFQPLGARLREAMTDFSDEEVATAHRFLGAMAQATAQLTEEIRPGPGR